MDGPVGVTSVMQDQLMMIAEGSDTHDSRDQDIDRLEYLLAADDDRRGFWRGSSDPAPMQDSVNTVPRQKYKVGPAAAHA